MNKPRFATREDAERGFELQIIDDAGKAIDWFITVLGEDSRAYREHIIATRREALEREKRIGDAQFDPALIEDKINTLAAKCTLGWRGDDALAEFSEANARQVYGDYPQIRNQVTQAVGRRANFLPGSPAN